MDYLLIALVPVLLFSAPFLVFLALRRPVRTAGKRKYFVYGFGVAGILCIVGAVTAFTFGSMSWVQLGGISICMFLYAHAARKIELIGWDKK